MVECGDGKLGIPSARAMAMEAPIPRVPPVTSAVWPESEKRSKMEDGVVEDVEDDMVGVARGRIEREVV